VTEDNISKETKAEALKIARGTQKPGQTKEQTKLIAHGIEKGIADYKKQQKGKARERDKLRKKELRAKEDKTEEKPEIHQGPPSTRLPWILLVVSWLSFVAYLLILLANGK
jgi:hypothetical protein